MKYRVKYQCYWWNTGAADNHYYIKCDDFETLKEAEDFRDRVNKQFEGFDDDLDQTIEIENGFISSEATIVKFYPSREELL